MIRKLTLYACLLLAQTGFSQTPALVADINPGSAVSFPLDYCVFNGKLYFTAYTVAASYELMQYDGVNPPSLVYDLNPGTGNGVAAPNSFRSSFVMGGKMYFCGQNASSGWEMFRYDGINPPSPVKDLVPGSGSSNLKPLLEYNNKLYCYGSTPANGVELYIYDGVNDPVLYDINPGAGDGSPFEFAVYNNKVYFRANTNATGMELYQYDPVTNTVSLAADIVSGAGSSSPEGLLAFNNLLYFTATTAANGQELYSYNGTSATRITDLSPGAGDGVRELAEFNGKLYLTGSTNGTSFQLYTYNSATGQPSLLYTINGSGSAYPIYYYPYHGKLYFSAKTATNGRELWATDGTTTGMVADIDAGPRDGVFEAMMMEYNGSLYFTGRDSATTGWELYRLTTPVGVQSVRFDGSVKIFPNPATDAAILELDLPTARTLSVLLSDATGRIVYQATPQSYPSGNSRINLPLSTLAAGTYQYSIRDAQQGLLQSGSLQKR